MMLFGDIEAIDRNQMMAYLVMMTAKYLEAADGEFVDCDPTRGAIIILKGPKRTSWKKWPAVHEILMYSHATFADFGRNKGKGFPLS